MKTLNYTFGYGSFETAESAINYDGRGYYNPPITIDIDGKVFILGCGTSDKKTVIIEDKIVYVICENTGLDYISLTRIDTETNQVEDCFLEGNYINHKGNDTYKIFNKSDKKKLSILKNYLPY